MSQIQFKEVLPTRPPLSYTLTIITKNQFTKSKQQINENASNHNTNKITKRSQTKSEKHLRITFTLKELPHNVLIRFNKNQCRKHRPRNASSMGSHNKSPKKAPAAVDKVSLGLSPQSPMDFYGFHIKNTRFSTLSCRKRTYRYL